MLWRRGCGQWCGAGVPHCRCGGAASCRDPRQSREGAPGLDPIGVTGVTGAPRVRAAHPQAPTPNMLHHNKPVDAVCAKHTGNEALHGACCVRARRVWVVVDRVHRPDQWCRHQQRRKKRQTQHFEWFFTDLPPLGRPLTAVLSAGRPDPKPRNIFTNSNNNTVDYWPMQNYHRPMPCRGRHRRGRGRPGSQTAGASRGTARWSA